MAAIVIAPDDPSAPDVRALLERHLAFANEHSPPEDVHALDSTRLASSEIAFFGARDGAELLAVGALKQLTVHHAELKSMHTAVAARGRGIGRQMLDHLLAEAAARGCTRVSLETGSPDAFVPARTMYASAGFIECAPFGDYSPSSYSTFMTLELSS